jgi:hypothetical protein
MALTTNQIARIQRTKRRLKIHSFDELEGLHYPTHFAAMLNYAATGEGVVQGVLLGYATSAIDLRAQIVAQWGYYHGLCAEVRAGLMPSQPYLKLMPKAVKTTIDELTRDGSLSCLFSFAATLRINLA